MCFCGVSTHGSCVVIFFFNDTATTDIYTYCHTLSLHDALPLSLRLLADADAFGSLALSRREALWEARRTPGSELPLFAAARPRELGVEPDMALPEIGRAHV